MPRKPKVLHTCSYFNGFFHIIVLSRMIIKPIRISALANTIL
jgi:hypothetical protein